MKLSPIFLAEGQMDPVLQSWRLSDPTMRERMMVFGAIGVVSVLALLCVIFLRRKRRRRRKHHHSSHHSASSAVAQDPAQEALLTPASDEHRRHRRKRRRHRPRNPTLAETGGLPPIRPEEPLKPSP